MNTQEPASIIDLKKILKYSLPRTEKIDIIETNHDDKSILINWRNHGYVVSSYHKDDDLSENAHVAVGRITSSKFSDDNSHILLEILLDKNYQIMKLLEKRDRIRGH